MAYDHKAIEEKWRTRWGAGDPYRTGDDTSKKKAFVLDMFPYPSGEGLHVGHPKGYVATDIYSRKKRMEGYNVLHPMGWDAFGLPAENFALKHKTHPREAVEKNIQNFKAQLAKLGFDYDWTREINTTDPGYYKWTQWIFLKLLEHGLAYESHEPINWCPSCMTGLANEDLDGNVCERCGTTVEKKRLPQWVLKITDYADRLLADLDTLDWPEHIKEAQRNWIGRSEGAEIDFPLAGGEERVTVFTTRPDTIFGATYLVVAPEHQIARASRDAKVREYLAQASTKTEIERSAAGKEKTGVELAGVRAINPATKEEIPVYVSDYVLGDYGTGALMGVPAHDERDHEFAKAYALPIRQVISKQYVQTIEPGIYRPDEPTLEKQGIIAVVKHWSEEKYLGLAWKEVAWGTFLTGGVEEGMTPEETVLKEIREETGYLHAKIVRKLGIVDGLFYHVPKQKNQLVHAHIFSVELADDAREAIAADEEAKHSLKWLTLDELATFLTPDTHLHSLRLLRGDMTPYTGAGSLVNSGEFTGRNSEEAVGDIVALVGGKTVVRYKIRDWVFSRQRYWGEPIPVVHCEKDGTVPVPYEELPVLLPEVAHYEPTGTGESPLAAISEWVNTTCPKCKGPAKRETNTMPQWAGSSWYYLRFMDPHNDGALVSTAAEKYWAPVDVYVGGDHAVRHLIYARFWHKFLYDIAVVSTLEPFARLEFLGFILAEDGRKMSKRLGNIINPDDVVEAYGADAFRIYEMFMGPFENTTSWSTAGIAGAARFVERVWALRDKVAGESVPELTAPLHRMIKKVGDDIEAFKFNTAVSAAMHFLNEVDRVGKIGTDEWSQFVRVLAPFAPHLAEELWELSGGEGSVHHAPWPSFDPARLIEAEVEVVVQVNGKRRGAVRLPTGASEEAAVRAAKADPGVVRALGGKEPSRVIYLGDRLLNLVVS